MIERTHFLGVDPGLSGGIALIAPDGTAWAWKIGPTEGDTAINFRAAMPIVKIAYIEKVHNMPADGGSSAFAFGRSYGFLRGLLVAFQIPFEEITPLKWQSKMQCMTGGDKNVSKQRAQQLWPHLRITHATADALLIAECCRRTFTGIGRADSDHGGRDSAGPDSSEEGNGTCGSDEVQAQLRAFQKASDGK